MMKRLLILLLFAGVIHGQSIPNGGYIAQGEVWTVAQWMNAWQAKTDVANGTLTNPTITTGTFTSPSITTGIFTNPSISFNYANGNASVGSSFNAGNVASVNVHNTALGQLSLGSGSAATNFTDNTAVGYNTLNALATNGCCETAVGKLALQNDVNGKFNTAVGSDTMRYFTGGGGTATGNTALGHGALGGDDTTPANNTASGNTALGAWTEQEITTGISNTCIGDSACVDLATGQNNVAVGFYAVAACTTFDTAGAPCANASYNVGVGSGALQNVQALGQTAVGTNALNLATTQVNNTAVGYQTLKSSATTTDTDNTVIGYNAAQALNGAHDETIVGSLAGSAITIGTGNILIGSHAGLLLTSGTFNTLIGNYAGQTITTGTNNLLISAGTSGTVGIPSPTTGQWLNVQNVIAGSMIAMTAGSNLTACGTSPVINAQATELNGTITTGTGVFSTCTLSFNVTHAAPPVCVVTARSGTPAAYTTSTVALVITTAATSVKYDYMCSGY